MPIETKVPAQAPRTLEAWVKLLESVRIPVPKHSHDRVIAAINDSRRSLRDIAELMQDSPALVLSVMREANHPANASQAELDKFGALANRWWDPQGPQRPLHELNPARLGYVAGRVTLAGARVLDVGCGAGLLSEALAREGAQVTALDLAPELIDVARLHLLESGHKVDYRLQPVEALAGELPAGFDASHPARSFGSEASDRIRAPARSRPPAGDRPDRPPWPRRPESPSFRR